MFCAQARDLATARAATAEKDAAECHYAVHAAAVAQQQRDAIQGLMDTKIAELKDMKEQRDARVRRMSVAGADADNLSSAHNFGLGD